MCIRDSYYLSNATPGLAVTRAALTSNELVIPVFHVDSGGDGGGVGWGAIVLPARDSGGDLMELVLGGLTTGGGRLRINAGPTNSVTIAIGDFVGTSKDVKLREINVCDDTGAAKKMLVLCSDAY
jgi:hypothetical protein